MTNSSITEGWQIPDLRSNSDMTAATLTSSLHKIQLSTSTSHLHCGISFTVSLSLHFQFIHQRPVLWHEIALIFQKKTFFWSWILGIRYTVGSLCSHMLVSKGGPGLGDKYTGAILKHIENPILRIANKQNKKPTWFSGMLLINTKLSSILSTNYFLTWLHRKVV